MKKFFENLSWQKGDSAFVRVLLSWRLWLVGAVVGAILGVVLSFVLPKQYETFATVIVDHNREQAWVNVNDKSIAYYYDIENRKLEAVALGDDVLERVVEEVPGISVVELRDGMLRIVKQYEGIWELHVSSNDAQLSQDVAKVWAVAFTEEVMGSLEFEKELEEARAEFLVLQDRELCEIEKNGTESQENWDNLDKNVALFKEIVRNSKGISPYVEINPVSLENLIVNETPINAVVDLLGVFLGILFVLGLGLFFLKEEN
jgi:hypothetical protein